MTILDCKSHQSKVSTVWTMKKNVRYLLSQLSELQVSGSVSEVWISKNPAASRIIIDFVVFFKN